MTYFVRFLIVSTCGLAQIFFALYLLLDLLNLSFFNLPSNAMFLPGVLIILGSGYLCASYYFGDKKMNNILYDEYSALRYYKLNWLRFKRLWNFYYLFYSRLVQLGFSQRQCHDLSNSGFCLGSIWCSNVNLLFGRFERI